VPLPATLYLAEAASKPLQPQLQPPSINITSNVGQSKSPVAAQKTSDAPMHFTQAIKSGFEGCEVSPCRDVSVLTCELME
jgi:hypothetical protein